MAAIKSVQDRQEDPQDQGKVHLSGDAPQQVWVRASTDGGHAEFATSSSGPWFRDGIKWECPHEAYEKDHSMFITLQLVDVRGVDCAAPVLYSPAIASLQYCAVPPSDTRVVYQFKVKLEGGMAIDPQIVVTPISPEAGGA
jgi:hypothetical protein